MTQTLRGIGAWENNNISDQDAQRKFQRGVGQKFKFIKERKRYIEELDAKNNCAKAG